MLISDKDTKTLLCKRLLPNLVKSNKAKPQTNRFSMQIGTNVVNPKIIHGWKLSKGANLKRIIPPNIFQTYHTLNVPIKMKQNIDKLKSANPEFKHHLFDDTMCRNFIDQNFEKDVLGAFDALTPGAYKADLWRYCVLYIHGGIYMDIKFGCVNNFKLVDLLDKEYYVRDRYNRGHYGIYQAFMVNLPKNPILLKCIRQIVENVRTKFYGKSPLCVTGPQLISNYFKQDDLTRMELYHGTEGDCVYVRGYKIINIYPTYRTEQKATAKTAHYGQMWRDKTIYANK
jgi:mannosyltransferase OCH1-like enzyme